MWSTIASSTSSMPMPVLARGEHRVRGVEADDLLDLLAHLLGVGGGQVDLVDDRHDLVVVLDRLVDVGERLRLDALRRVDHQQRALAGGEARGYLIGEVDVAGRVHQVELIRRRPFQSSRTVCALMVIPRSRSMSILSSTCALRPSRARSGRRCAWISRSASVDLPWSISDAGVPLVAAVFPEAAACRGRCAAKLSTPRCA